jgi:hypothetical protein
LHVSTNTIVQSVNEINNKVTYVKEKMGSALNEISSKSRESKRDHEELMEGLGEAFSTMGKSLLEIK